MLSLPYECENCLKEESWNWSHQFQAYNVQMVQQHTLSKLIISIFCFSRIFETKCKPIQGSSGPIIIGPANL